MILDAPIAVQGLNHHFGKGELRRQVLFDVSCEIQKGEIVIVTGPSGSGKTTLLTLVGALRRTRHGSLRILGRELCGAREAELIQVRRQIGYIFQEHNLLDSLPAWRNVELALRLRSDLSSREMRQQAAEAMDAVGLGDRLDASPSELSVGQKQRVAVARALAGRPSVILADEPTASLDRESGRAVVELIQRLVKQRGCTVILVTHDNRILDVADRIIHLEDGRVVSLSEMVLANTQQMLTLLAEDTRSGTLSRQLERLPPAQFAVLLDRVTVEFQHFLSLLALANTTAFESMLEQVLVACTLKVGEILRADRVALFLVDRDREQLWSKVAQHDGGRPLDIKVPLGVGIVGHVALSGETYRVADAYDDPRFHRAVDRRTGYRTRSVLCVPLKDARGEVFAVAQVLNKQGGGPFDDADEARFSEFAGSIGIILESWWRMSGEMSAQGSGAVTPQRVWSGNGMDYINQM